MKTSDPEEVDWLTAGFGDPLERTRGKDAPATAEWIKWRDWALGRIATIDDASLRTKQLRAFGERLFFLQYHDFQEHAAWIGAVSLPEDERIDFELWATSRLASNDRYLHQGLADEALSWAWDRLPTERRAAALLTLTQQCDANTFAEWFAARPDIPPGQAAPALHRFAAIIAKNDPEAALAWVARIGIEDERAAAEADVAAEIQKRSSEHAKTEDEDR